jgi:hypothetical protein
MKRISLVIITLTLLSFSSFAQSGKAEQQILDLSKRKFDWLVNKNTDSLKYFLDEQVKYIHSNGWTQTKHELIDDCISGKLVYQKIEINEATVRLYGTTAIVTGKGKFSGAVNQTTFAMDLAYTEVYIKKDNYWLLVSRHSNKMP